MGFRCGIVGSSNVGKSTLFNALTKAGIEAASFSLRTIEPNTGIVPMPDPRLDQLAEIVKPQCTLPVTIEFVDIADSIKDAPEGEGLGNQFLTNIRETEVVDHAVRCFESNNIIRVSDRVNPVDDIEVISIELTLVDLDTCERTIHRAQKKAKDGDKDMKVELAVLEKCLPQLENAGILRALDLSAEEKATVRYLSSLTLKSTIYIASANEGGFENSPYLNQVREIAAKESPAVVPVCAAAEADTAGLDNEECDEFVQKLGLEELGLNRVTRAGYKLLNLQTYFIAGVKEVRVWTIPVGATAPQAAGKIHTDFERGLIHIQTISFENFITYKGEQGAEEAGKVRAEGKDHVVKDGDVTNFPFDA